MTDQNAGMPFTMAPDHIHAALAAILEDGSTAPVFIYDYVNKLYIVSLPRVLLTDAAENGGPQAVAVMGATPDEALERLWRTVTDPSAELIINPKSVKRRRIVRWDRYLWRMLKVQPEAVPEPVAQA